MGKVRASLRDKLDPWKPSHWPLLTSDWSVLITWPEYRPLIGQGWDASPQGISLSCVIITTKLSSTEKQNAAPPLCSRYPPSRVFYSFFVFVDNCYKSWLDHVSYTQMQYSSSSGPAHPRPSVTSFLWSQFLMNGHMEIYFKASVNDSPSAKCRIEKRVGFLEHQQELLLRLLVTCKIVTSFF